MAQKFLDYYLANQVRKMLKFRYSDKATIFCEISTLDLTVTTVESSQNLLAFSEYMIFKEFDPIISLSVYLEKLADHFLP